MIDKPFAPPPNAAPAPWAGAPWHGGPYPSYTWAAPPPRPVAVVSRPRWGATAAVAAVIAVVVLGGLLADGAIAAPSVGRLAVSGPVTIEAAPGWVVSDSAGEVSDGVALQDSSVLLIVQVVSSSYRGDDRALLDDAEASLGSDAGQFTFGDSRVVTLGGREASEVTFSALVSSGGSSGVIDGELVCVVVESGGSAYAVVMQAGAAQGGLASVADDVDSMAASLEASR